MERIFLLLTVLCFFSCSEPANPGSANEVPQDSLARALDAPDLQEINKKILEDAGNADLYHQRAQLYFQLQELSPAVNDVKRAIRIDSTKAVYYLTLVDLYFSQNETRLARETLEITERKFPENTEALLKLAELYWLVRQYQNGLNYVNKALRIDEHLARGYFIKGGIYRESGDTAKALSSLRTAVEQNNAFIDAFYDLGVIYGARKDTIAFQYYDNVLRLAPAHSEALYAKAKLLQDIGRIDEAISVYEALVAADSGCSQCHYNLGAVILELKNNPQEALAHFTRAIEADPSFVQAYFARGYTYAKLNQTERAKADYRTCLKISPGFEPAVTGLNAIE